MLSLLHSSIEMGSVSQRPLMRILLADDEVKVLSALNLIIGSEPGMVVVGEATDVQSLHAQLSRHLPDLLLLDWELPDLQPVKTVPTLRKLYPSMRIVALSSHPEVRLPTLAAGADAFVGKGEVPERLLLALHRLAAMRDA